MKILFDFFEVMCRAKIVVKKVEQKATDFFGFTSSNSRSNAEKGKLVVYYCGAHILLYLPLFIVKQSKLISLMYRIVPRKFHVPC